ncbi:MAG: RimK/LysX family protein, partial [bacterium]|nr:RimK/LysX family protein [bacterium]
DLDFAREIGIYSKSQVLWKRKKLSSLGEEERPVIPMTFWLAGRKIKTNVTVADRSELRYQLLIGRVDLSGFLISAEIDKDKLKEAKWQ